MKFLTLIAMLAFPGAVLLGGNEPTPDFKPSMVIPRINVDVDKKTQQVHFISTNNDPDVLSKAYVLRYADPFEIIPYIRAAANSRRVNTSDTKVEAIKYMDGTGILLVSAEDYRFGKAEIGMNIDDIINVLDRPNVSFAANRKYFLYFPKYWASAGLEKIIYNVGIIHPQDKVELQGGIDQVTADVGLNALFFYASPFSVKTIQKMLDLYDTPTPEALIKYTIYELDFENDSQIGVDFQAWKNGPGVDLFAVAARYSNGWDFLNQAGGNKWVRSDSTRYINFSPKWNSKYLDFLVSKSKAKVITSGSLSLMNRSKGIIQCVTRMADIQDGKKLEPGATLQQYLYLSGANWNGSNFTGAATVGDYRLAGAVDERTGEAIAIFQSNPATAAPLDFVATRSIVGGKIYYYLQLNSTDGANTAYFRRADGANLGSSCRALNVQIQQYQLVNTASGVNSWVNVENWSVDRQYTVDRDVTRITKINEYGFSMIINPTVCNNATTLEIEMQNTSLIGFQDNGKPRTAKTDLKTTIMFNNRINRFVIGGLEREAVVRSVSKVPWLGSLPYFGWLFSTESEMTKKSQFVAVIESSPAPTDMKIPTEIESTISKMRSNMAPLGATKPIKNKLGFDQFMLDKNKRSPDPAP